MRKSLDRMQSALAGRYAIEREIGSGGMATVHLATDLKHGRHVALKVLRSELAATLGAERFLREIQITARLNHPHILPLLDSGYEDGYLYYVMPYVAGVSLRGLLNSDQKLSIDQVVRVALKVAAALDHAHGLGVIHRDIKPENILFSEGFPVVADFGIAKAVSAAGPENLTKSGFPLGTPGYMSPEQAAGRLDADERSDVCGLGSVVYEMLIGDTPGVWPLPEEVESGKFSDVLPEHRALLDHLPGNVEEVLVRSLAIRATQRHATPTEFAKALAVAANRGDILEDSETREILGRASILEAQRQHEEQREGGDDVKKVAADVGLGPSSPDRRPGKPLPTPSDPRSVPSTGGSFSLQRGGKLRFQRETPGEISDTAHEGLMDEIDTSLGIVGRITPFGRSLTWSPAAPSDEERNVVVKITPQEGRTRIFIEERIELSGWEKLLPAIGGAVGAALGFLVGSLLEATVGVLGFTVLALGLLGYYGAGKATTWGVCRRRRPQLERLANRLAERTARSQWVSGELSTSNIQHPPSNGGLDDT